MTDKLTAEARSALMSRVRNKNTKPELVVRSILHRMGFRFRIHQRTLPGTPDIVLARHRTAIFVHGCFWHSHANCRRGRLPTSRSDFWEAKIRRNIERDSVAEAALDSLGYRVLVLWECEVKDEESVRGKLRRHFGEKAVLHGAAVTN